MICPTCGAVVTGTTVCAQCGKPLKSGAVYPTPDRVFYTIELPPLDEKTENGRPVQNNWVPRNSFSAYRNPSIAIPNIGQFAPSPEAYDPQQRYGQSGYSVASQQQPQGGNVPASQPVPYGQRPDGQPASIRPPAINVPDIGVQQPPANMPAARVPLVASQAQAGQTPLQSSQIPRIQISDPAINQTLRGAAQSATGHPSQNRPASQQQHWLDSAAIPRIEQPNAQTAPRDPRQASGQDRPQLPNVQNAAHPLGDIPLIQPNAGYASARKQDVSQTAFPATPSNALRDIPHVATPANPALQAQERVEPKVEGANAQAAAMSVDELVHAPAVAVPAGLQAPASEPSHDAARHAGLHAASGVPAHAPENVHDVHDDAPQSTFIPEEAPKTAFVLVVVGLVLCALGISALAGIVCCAIGLALNAKYVREDKVVQRKTLTKALGVIGIVLGLALSAVLALVVVLPQFGIGSNIQSAPSETSPSAAQSADSARGDNATAAGSSMAASGSRASSANESDVSGSSARAAEGAEGVEIDERYFDQNGNLTLYPVCELSGEQLEEALEQGGFSWVAGANAWMSSDGSIVEVEGSNGTLSAKEVAKLEAGGSGSSVAYVVMTKGYAAPVDALKALSQDVELSETRVSKSDFNIAFARISNSVSEDYLVAATQTEDNQQTVMVFTEKAVEQGLFSTIIGVDVGTSIDEIWKVLATA